MDPPKHPQSKDPQVHGSLRDPSTAAAFPRCTTTDNGWRRNLANLTDAPWTHIDG